MIPKIIHYCWFGNNPLPASAVQYIESWKFFCPDYQIIEWNEANFDVNTHPYTREAYEAKKWAFVTDYVRLYVLDTYGGIYMDTDVELVKPLTMFLSHKGFTGFELPTRVPTGIMASIKGHPFIRSLLAMYDHKHFICNENYDLTTNVELISSYVEKKGLCLNNTVQTIEDFTFYPTDFFCPKNNRTLEIIQTENTTAIHHFSGSWIPKKTKWTRFLKRLLGSNRMKFILDITDRLNITGK